MPGSPKVPYAFCHSPFEALHSASGEVVARGIINLPALFIILVLSLLLIRGMKESAFVNGLIVITKVSIVVLAESVIGCDKERATRKSVARSAARRRTSK